MEKEYYKISKDKLLYLLRRDAKLDLLEKDGVDNWDGYYDSYSTYLEEELGLDYNEESEMRDVALKRLKQYEKIQFYL